MSAATSPLGPPRLVSSDPDPAPESANDRAVVDQSDNDEFEPSVCDEHENHHDWPEIRCEYNAIVDIIGAQVRIVQAERERALRDGYADRLAPLVRDWQGLVREILRTIREKTSVSGGPAEATKALVDRSIAAAFKVQFAYRIGAI